MEENPTLADQAPYEPEEVFDDFLTERRAELDKQLAEEPVGERAPGQGLPLAERDRREILFLDQLRHELQNNGPAAIKPIFHIPNPMK